MHYTRSRPAGLAPLLVPGPLYGKASICSESILEATRCALECIRVSFDGLWAHFALVCRHKWGTAGDVFASHHVASTADVKFETTELIGIRGRSRRMSVLPAKIKNTQAVANVVECIKEYPESLEKEICSISSWSRVLAHWPCPKLEMFCPSVLQHVYGCSKVLMTNRGMSFLFFFVFSKPAGDPRSATLVPDLANQVWPFKEVRCSFNEFSKPIRFCSNLAETFFNPFPIRICKKKLGDTMLVFKMALIKIPLITRAFSLRFFLLTLLVGR